MYVALVQIHVKPDCVEAFIEATLDNCRNSIQEPGVAAFDLLQSQDDATRFTLYEMYRSPEAQLAHRETAHYLRWRDAVEPLQAEARSATKHDVVLQAKE